MRGTGWTMAAAAGVVVAVDALTGPVAALVLGLLLLVALFGVAK